jgi:predicted homoserine dehydrogenase-like protein
MASADTLAALRARRNPVRLGLVGAGAMGKGILYQTLATPGVRCVALCDLDLGVATRCAEALGIPYEVVENASTMEMAIRTDRLAICQDGMLVAGCEQVEVFVESSSSITAGAQFTVAAIEAGKHVNLMNAEIDLVFGPYFLDLARGTASPTRAATATSTPC